MNLKSSIHDECVYRKPMITNVCWPIHAPDMRNSWENIFYFLVEKYFIYQLEYSQNQLTANVILNE